MIRFRPFRNSDPPRLLEVWRQQSPVRGLMQPISNILLEMFVLSKPYFDRHGLIVAVDDDRVVGFAHAGFGPNGDRSRLSHDIGVLCVLIAANHPQRPEILVGLIDQMEEYLRATGAQQMRIGGSFPVSPFYMGLSGGSDLLGVQATDEEMDQLYRSRGYNVLQRTVVYERALSHFRSPVDRRLVQHRRKFRIVARVNPTDSVWWDTCVFGPTDRIHFLLQSKEDDATCGEVTFWDMGPVSTRPGAGGMGMINLQVYPEFRERGLGTFLVGEALKQLQASGISRVETQAAIHSEPAIRILQRLDFTELRQGILYDKTASE